MTEIVMEKSVLPGGGSRFDLIGKDLPGATLGLGADLNWRSPFKEGDYQGMVLSPVWKELMAQGRLMALAKEDTQKGRIVVGFAEKAGLMLPLPDGLIASFSFKSVDPEFSGFDNQVLSIWENGRKNIAAQWTARQSDPVAVKTEAVAENVLQPADSDLQSEEISQLSDQRLDQVSEQTMSEVSGPLPVLPGSNVVERIGGWELLWIGGLFVVVSASLAAVFYYKSRVITGRKPLKEDLRLVEGADFA